MVPHGFRSTIRDWAAEETDYPREVIEAALAHVVRNRVEAALAHVVANRVEATYARPGLFDQTGHVLSNRGPHFCYVIRKGMSRCPES